ncbi:MAG: winged helix-turn-helix domain-containing protein [Patescibacteria group bacterium]|nr:winged helix-turn-helix domain-containing protein [Patescibacteria group bacterium]
MDKDKVEKKEKSYYELERIIKGVANHRRIEILEMLGKKPEMSVAEIAEKVKSNFKTTSDHIRKIAVAGLLMKRSDSKSVRHKLTKRGEFILKFLRMLE